MVNLCLIHALVLGIESCHVPTILGERFLAVLFLQDYESKQRLWVGSLLVVAQTTAGIAAGVAYNVCESKTDRALMAFSTLSIPMRLDRECGRVLGRLDLCKLFAALYCALFVYVVCFRVPCCSIATTSRDPRSSGWMTTSELASSSSKIFA